WRWTMFRSTRPCCGACRTMATARQASLRAARMLRSGSSGSRHRIPTAGMVRGVTLTSQEAQTLADVEAAEQQPFYIPATGSPTRPRRSLKHDDTFAVLDSHGDMGTSSGGADGIFDHDTRFLSRLEMLLNGMQPLLLGSNLRDDNALLTIDLTNPDVYFEKHLVLEKDTLHI